MDCIKTYTSTEMGLPWSINISPGYLGIIKPRYYNDFQVVDCEGHPIAAFKMMRLVGRGPGFRETVKDFMSQDPKLKQMYDAVKMINNVHAGREPISPCKVCQRVAPLVNDECPDCRH